MPASAAWRRALAAALVGAALLFGALAVIDAWVVAGHLRGDAVATSRLFGNVFRGLTDPRPDAAADALLELAAEIRRRGLPLAVTDTAGRVTAFDNAPPGVTRADTARLRAWVAELDRTNAPVVTPGVGTVHYGALPVARRLTTLALLQLAVLLSLAALLAGLYRTRLVAARDRLWVAMARESAHQLGTPLMSLTGWVDYLKEHPGAPPEDLTRHLEADVERLHRVARRFERIGRPARREPVGLGAAASRVVEYFTPRLPTLAAPVALSLSADGAGPTVEGDAVLVEWAVEALVKNAIDALSGRGGHVAVRVERSGDRARIVVADDGPGVPAAIRARLFEPGASTKAAGWGLGLALTRRIVERQHGGRLTYRPAQPGSEFVIEFPIAPA